MALEDPLHYGYHRIFAWNKMVFDEAKLKAEKEFDKAIEKPKKKTGKENWTSLNI
jgi:hypothetical protein